MITSVGQEMASRPTRIGIPAGALVVLIGAAASGKSTFAARQFDGDWIVASDRLRVELTGATPDDVVFAELHRRVQAALVAGRTVVVDATNTDWMRRAELISRAHNHGRPAIAIAFDLPLELCLARNATRRRTVVAGVIRRQHGALRRDLDRLDVEGFRSVHVLRTVHEVEQAAVQIEKGPVARAISS